MAEVKKSKFLVIGAGPGGYPAAFHLADHATSADNHAGADSGSQLCIVEPRENPGGVCVYEGCIPSKALLHIAHLLDHTKEAHTFGLNFGKPELDIAKMRAYKEQVVAKLTKGTGQLTRNRNIEHVQGAAKFLDPHTVLVEGKGKTSSQIQFEKAIIATGSRPITQLPFFKPFSQSNDSAFTNPNLWTAKEALAMDFTKIPQTMLVIGGGYIGLELASVYQSFGSKVTVIEKLPRLVAATDADLVRRLEMKLKKSGIEFLMECEVKELKESKGGFQVTYTDAKQSHQKEFERVLVSIGRVPNSDALDLQKAEISLPAANRGFIPVDAQRRTEQKHICAIGDVAGGLLLAHKATHEGICAAEALLDKKTEYNPYAIPAVIYTNPEIATTGISETEATEKEIPVKVMAFPWAACGRAVSINETTGFTKILADPESGRILGMGIVGPGAGEMISEGTLAIEMGATARDLADTIHPHPTLSETVMEAAELFYGSCTHLPKKR